MRSRNVLRTKLLPASLLLIPLLVSSSSFAAEIDDIHTALKNNGAKWTAAETSVYKLPAAARKKLNGFVPEVALAPGQQAVSPNLSMLSAPTGTFDWRNFGGTNYVSSVRNQGACGDCWAFAATAGLESYVLLHGNYDSSINLSEQVVVSCSNAGSCNGGSPAGAAAFIMGTGVPSESYYPYTATNGSCSSAGSGWQNAADKVVSWQYVTYTNPDLATLKNAVYTFGPIVTTMMVYADFYAYSSGVYHHVTGALEGGHAILIVGYTDNATYPGGGYFTVKNSWGTSWGEPGGSDSGGYFRIAYKELTTVTKFGWYSIAYDTKPACTYSQDNSGSTEPSSGATSGFGLTTTSSCPWTASSNATWLTLGATSGMGNANVAYTAASNATSAARTGTITVKDQIGRSVGTYTVSQQGCSYTLAASSATPSDAGGAASVGLTVSSPNGAWTAASSATWLVISSGKSGTGNGTISYTVAPNTGSAARTGTITVKDSTGKAMGTLAVTQAGAVFTVSADSGSYSKTGGTGGITVAVDRSDATWTAVSSATSWLVIKSGAKVTGNGSVSYTVAPNTTSLARTGTITLKDINSKVVYTLTVTEAPSTFAVSASSGSFTKAGGSGSISVTVDSSSATWTAVSSATTWLVVKSGATGTGNGSVSYTAAPNTGTTAKSGTITIKDSGGNVILKQTVTVSAT